MLTNDVTSNSQNQTVPDIFDIVNILRRHKKLIAKIMISCCLAGLLIIYLLPSYYRAYATIVLSDQSLNISDFQSLLSGVKMDNMSVQTEVKILNSHSLALQTVKNGKLIEYPEYSWAKNEEEVASAFIRNLSIDTQGASRAIEISFKAKDPKLAAYITNLHANSYLESQVEFKKQQAEKLRDWFEIKVKELKADAIKKAQAVQDYRAKEKLAIGKDNTELIYQQISDVAGQLVPVEVSKFGMQAKTEELDDAEATGNPALSDDVIKSPLIQKLKEQANIASQELGSLRAKYGHNHPKVVEARSKLNQVNGAIAEETAMIQNSMRQNQTITENQEGLLKTRLDSLNKKADDLREKMITLESLQIEADASKKILDNFLKNYESIQSQVTFAWPDATLISPAVIPSKPAPPGKKMMMLFVIVFSACSALAVIFIKEMMNSGLKNFDDIRKLNQKPLGIMPLVVNPIGAMLGSTQNSYREAIKRIYMSGLMGSSARSILVTSAMPKEGRTTFVISMAHYLLSLGHKVIVIDADFLRPTLSRIHNKRKDAGLTDVLAHKISLADAITTDKNGLAVLSAGTESYMSPDLLQPANIEGLLARLKRDYSFVLIDSGPIMAHSEAAAFAKQAEGIVVVTEWLKTSEKNIGNLFFNLESINNHVLGVVINKVDIGKYKEISTGSDFLLPKAANAA